MMMYQEKKDNLPTDQDKKKDEFLQQIRDTSTKRIDDLHQLAKRLWLKYRSNPLHVQNKCRDAWDKIGLDLETKIIPFVPITEERPASNLIFGSGGFSTGEFQIKQYQRLLSYLNTPPMLLQGLVTNKSEQHQCNAKKLSQHYNLPLIEVDYMDWYHQYISSNEPNPIQATRYWYLNDDPSKPSFSELEKRFKIRQDQFHKYLGEQLFAKIQSPIDSVSARGYNFQFCRNIFLHQKNPPQINDTHPADLTYVDPTTKERLYPGWQSGAIELMIKDKQKRFRGSLIEVEYMDTLQQARNLDEGVLLSIGNGIEPDPTIQLNAKEIQEAMKIMDDYFFCTLEPTGLLLLWGISEKPLWVSYQDLQGKIINIKQRLVFVGNKLHSGLNAWGVNLKKDIQEIEDFLLD